MFDGLWAGKWDSNISHGFRSLVLVFHQGKIFGGNDLVYCIGTFASEGNQFHGDLQVHDYVGEPLSIFGLLTSNQPEVVSITGHISGDVITLEGVLKSDRRVKVEGLLNRKAGSEIF